MFTPPPSPLPPPQIRLVPAESDAENGSDEVLFAKAPLCSENPVAGGPTRVVNTEAKSAQARRTRWTVLLVPAVLILITLSTRHLSHLAAFDILADPADAWPASLVDWSSHSPHLRRSPVPEPQAISLTNPLSGPTSSPPQSQTSPSPSPSTSADQTDQTVPPVPTTPPLLPTPFPQPFDTVLSNNFSTQGCLAFFTNMTQTDPFRTCRPLSLLQLSSSAFITSQTNLSRLNTLIWGTCNTTPSFDQCTANMAWFAEEIQDVCKIDLSDRVKLVVDALAGLQAYSVMRTAGCTVDQRTSTYCYTDAVHASNPSDLYFYQLPLGGLLPNMTKPTCSACTKSVLAVFAAQASNLTALETTYPPAAQLAEKACGQGYVQIHIASASSLQTGRMALVLSVVMGLTSILWLS